MRLQGIAQLTVGVKLAQILNNATHLIQPKIARKKPRGRRGKRKQPSKASDLDTASAARQPQDVDADSADADEDSDGGLNDILDASLADLASDDESGGSGPGEDIDLDDADVDVIGSALDGVKGKAVRAVVARDEARRKRHKAAKRLWDQAEVGKSYQAIKP